MYIYLYILITVCFHLSLSSAHNVTQPISSRQLDYDVILTLRVNGFGSCKSRKDGSKGLNRVQHNTKILTVLPPENLNRTHHPGVLARPCGLCGEEKSWHKGQGTIPSLPSSVFVYALVPKAKCEKVRVIQQTNPCIGGPPANDYNQKNIIFRVES